MHTDARGNQVPEPGDLVKVADGPATCICGRWRAVTLEGKRICAGCDQIEDACRCGKTISLVFRSVSTTPVGMPESARLKGLLKIALRAFGFRCVSIDWSDEGRG